MPINMKLLGGFTRPESSLQHGCRGTIIPVSFTSPLTKEERKILKQKSIGKMFTTRKSFIEVPTYSDPGVIAWLQDAVRRFRMVSRGNGAWAKVRHDTWDY